MVFGNPDCFDYFYKNIDSFKYSTNFDFVEELHGNHGKTGFFFKYLFSIILINDLYNLLVRDKAQLIVNLLKNQEILKEHRNNLTKLQEKVLKRSIFFEIL